MSKFLEKEDAEALELINCIVKNQILKKKIIAIYMCDIRKNERHIRNRKIKMTSIDQNNRESLYALCEVSKLLPIFTSEVIQKESNRIIYNTIKELTFNERKVIWLLYFCDKTTVEIAKKFGITQQAISKTKKRALNKMSCNAKLRELYLDEN